MYNQAGSKAIIIVPLDNIYHQVRNLFKQELPLAWFDNNEINEIILRIFDITVNNILNEINLISSNTYKECYQGNIDYLEYCGISQTTAFKITHVSEMGILKEIFNICPVLDDKNMFTIEEHKIMNMCDLYLTVKIKK